MVSERCIVVVYVVTSFIIGGRMDNYFELDWVNLYGPTRVKDNTSDKILGKSLRSVQRERKRNGVSNPVGRPKKVSEIDFSGTISDVCSKYGISKRTYYRLKQK